MRLKINEQCSGHGRCAKYAPKVFTLDDNGYNGFIGREFDVPPGEEKNAERGIRACPEGAILKIEE